jgi:hypothetical protein
MLQHWGLDTEVFKQRLYVGQIERHGQLEYQFKLNPETFKELEKMCNQSKPKLIVIDGLRAIMEGDESSSRDTDALMGPLVKLACRFRAAMVISHHLNKGCELLSIGGSKPTLDWLRGSTNIGAACRSVWIVDIPNPAKPKERRLSLVKTASGPIGQNMAFVMEDPRNGLHFIGKVPEPEPRFQKDKMEKWLIETLQKNEPMTKKELHEHADKARFTRSCLDKLMSRLRSTKKIDKVSEGGKTLWRLYFTE